MYKGHQVVTVVPAGRRQTLQLLARHLLAAKPLIDQCHLWVNTYNKEDLQYIDQLITEHPDFFQAIESNVPINGNRSISCFYGSNYRKPGTIYIKIDDDVVWLEKNSILNMLESRLNNPNCFLIFGNIWNNQLCDHLHQRSGLLRQDPFIRWLCTGNSWGDGKIAESIHLQLLNLLDENVGVAQLATFDQWWLRWNERCSINFVCWLGEDLAALSPAGILGPLGGGDDEQYLCCEAPKLLGKWNLISGRSLAAHYAFHPQKKYLDGTDILSRWQRHLPRDPSELSHPRACDDDGKPANEMAENSLADRNDRKSEPIDK